MDNSAMFDWLRKISGSVSGKQLGNTNRWVLLVGIVYGREYRCKDVFVL